MTYRKACGIVQKNFTWLSFSFRLCTVVDVRISCFKNNDLGGFHTCLFFFLLLTMMCFTRLYVCVQGLDQQCWVAVPGGRVGSMDIKPDSTGTGALASEWAKVCTIVESPSPAYGRSGGGPQTGPRVSRGGRPSGSHSAVWRGAQQNPSVDVIVLTMTLWEIQASDRNKYQRREKKGGFTRRNSWLLPLMWCNRNMFVILISADVPNPKKRFVTF